MSKVSSLLESRRFWVAVAGGFIASFGEQLGISQATISELVLVASAWILGDSLWKTGGDSGFLQGTS